MEDNYTGGVVAAFVATVALVIIGAIVLLGWWVGWWFKTQNTNRESHLYEHEYGHQSSLISDIANKQETIANIDTQLAAYVNGDTDQTAALKSQRLFVANNICADAAQLNGNYDGLSSDQRSFVVQNCDGASVSATSSLRK